ncbi:MAG: hypothetical protein HQK97_03020 [Nitrospirae bacterium]|nr:hypothetical protein [Nitrospirota bacterium]
MGCASDTHTVAGQRGLQSGYDREEGKLRESKCPECWIALPELQAIEGLQVNIKDAFED